MAAELAYGRASSRHPKRRVAIVAISLACATIIAAILSIASPLQRYRRFRDEKACDTYMGRVDQVVLSASADASTDAVRYAYSKRGADALWAAYVPWLDSDGLFVSNAQPHIAFLHGLGTRPNRRIVVVFIETNGDVIHFIPLVVRPGGFWARPLGVGSPPLQIGGFYVPADQFDLTLPAIDAADEFPFLVCDGVCDESDPAAFMLVVRTGNNRRMVQGRLTSDGHIRMWERRYNATD